MTVRKVVTPSGRGVRGYYASKKMQMMIVWESILERDAILLLEFLATVVRYWAQPVKIFFYQDGIRSLYYPDFRIEGIDGKLTHIEVKPASKLKNPVLQKRLAAIKQHHEEINIGFKVLDETVLRKEPRLTNLKLLAYHLPPLNADLRESGELLEKLSILTPKTIGGAAVILGDIQLVYQLIALGHYHCDLDSPISSDTLIFPGKGDRHDALFL